LKTFLLGTTWFGLLLFFAVAAYQRDELVPLEVNVFLWAAFTYFCAYVALSGIVGHLCDVDRASRFGFALFGVAATFALFLPNQVSQFYSWGDMVVSWLEPTEFDSNPTTFLPRSYTPKHMINLMVVSLVATVGSVIGAAISRKRPAE